MALAYYQVLQAGGFTSGGTNFDSKLRRQSLDPADLLIGHIGGMDCCARGLKAAAKMVEDGALSKPLSERYAKWDAPEAQKMLRGEYKLEDIAAKVERDNINPEPKSGRQEYLENVVNRYV
jgi:xylose isomerase